MTISQPTNNSISLAEGDLLSVLFDAIAQQGSLSTISAEIKDASNGSLVHTIPLGNSGNTYSGSWLSTQGSYNLVIIVADDQGGYFSKIIPVTVSPNQSTITFISPVANELMNGGVVDVQFSVSDNEGLASVKAEVIDNSILDPSNPFRSTALSITDDGLGNYSGSWNAFTQGDFTIKVTAVDLGGRTTTSEITVTIDKQVGIDQSTAYSESSMTIYPNPTIDDAYVDFNVTGSGTGSLIILDINGNYVKTIAEGDFSSGLQTKRLETNDLKIGIYILKLNIDDQVIINKFVKE